MSFYPNLIVPFRTILIRILCHQRRKWRTPSFRMDASRRSSMHSNWIEQMEANTFDEKGDVRLRVD